MSARRFMFAVVAAAVVAAAAAGTLVDESSSAARSRPNIVFVLTDDLAWNLVKFMPNVRKMQKQGVTFSRYFVTDSLCCPSRASIFTGKFPHDTRIFTNTGRYGGFPLFHSLGEERSTFAKRLHDSGYLTALMGKYLNGYEPRNVVDGRVGYVPPGWDEWDVGGNAYPEFNYDLSENGRLVRYGHRPADYLTDVLARKASSFIRRAALVERKPFLLEVATFAPHSPYTPAPRHRGDFPRLRAPRNPAFDERDISDKPTWLQNKRGPLTRLQIKNLDDGFRKRAESVESVDQMLGRLEHTLAATHQLANTYIFFSSDNGYHMGEHRLTGGKMTAFETDIRVPLIVTGPGVPHRQTVRELTSNIDLYPTFVGLAGLGSPPSIDGTSLVALVHGEPVPGWRQAVLVEHRGPDRNPADPDFQSRHSGNPVSYNAIRTSNATYVEYANRELEYYELRHDPYELTNRADALPQALHARLHAQLAALVACKGAAACWRAAGGS